MASDNTEKQNITQLGKGLNTDFSPQVQPEGSYRFALNAVNEAELGDSMFLSNEESNEISVTLPIDFVPIGKKYIGNGNSVIFVVNRIETISKILLFNEKGSLEVLLDDSSSVSEDKLNFKLSQQIDCTYRLRRGSERTIYFTDDYNPPRYFNLEKPYIFKNTDGTVKASTLNLFSTFDKIPVFEEIVVTREGSLLPGSYNIAIQYVDSDLNPTEWINTTDTIIIYNDDYSNPFHLIRGSTNVVNSYQNFGPTSKAIRVKVNNLDDKYPTYRLALIEANNGSGIVNRVSTTELISIDDLNFIFTGSNTVEEITEEELKAFSTVLERVSHIEQLENRLLLSNVKGKDVDWYKLQKYASTIETDLVLKEVVLNDINSVDNPKNSLVNVNNVSYMPGEIYSLGIVWVFKDGTTTPVFHIPGRDSEPSTNKMSTDNECVSSEYNNLAHTVGQEFANNPISEQKQSYQNNYAVDKEVNENIISVTSEETEVTYSGTVEVKNVVPSYVTFSAGNESDYVAGNITLGIYAPREVPTKVYFSYNYFNTIGVKVSKEDFFWIDPGDVSVSVDVYKADIAEDYFYMDSVTILGIKCSIYMNHTSILGNSFNFIFSLLGQVVGTARVDIISGNVSAYGTTGIDLLEYDSYTIVPIEDVKNRQKYTVTLQRSVNRNSRINVSIFHGSTITNHVVTILSGDNSADFIIEDSVATNVIASPLDVIDSVVFRLVFESSVPSKTIISLHLTDELGSSYTRTFTINANNYVSDSITLDINRLNTTEEISKNINTDLHRIMYFVSNSHPTYEEITITSKISLGGNLYKSISTVFLQDETQVFTNFFNLPLGVTSYDLATILDKPCVYPIENNNNNKIDFWGLDAHGNQLLGNKIRHHRFPLRSEIDETLVKDTDRYSEISNPFPIIKIRSNQYITHGSGTSSAFYLDLVDKDAFTIGNIITTGGVDYTILTINNSTGLITTSPSMPSGSHTFTTSVTTYKTASLTGQSLVFSYICTPINGEPITKTVDLDPLDPYLTTEGGYLTVNGDYVSTVQHYNSTGELIVVLSAPGKGDFDMGDLTITVPNPNNTLNCYLEKVPHIDREYLDTVKTTKIFGLSYSNIRIPSLEDTNGNEIVGYYIVRNERTEQQKTILDTGVLLPLLVDVQTDVPSRFVSSGYLMPTLNYTNNYKPLKKDVVGFINPEFKFNNREYKNFSILHEGSFVLKYRNKRLPDVEVSRMYTQDVQSGTSYNPDVNTHSGKDNDGFSLHTVVKNNTVEYQRVLNTVIGTLNSNNFVIKEEYLPYLSVGDKITEKYILTNIEYTILTIDSESGVTTTSPTMRSGIGSDVIFTTTTNTPTTNSIGEFPINNIDEVFYLNALSYKNVVDTDNNTVPIYNIASDNKIGIISLKEKLDIGKIDRKLPYVVLKSNITESYSTFRTLPYYKETEMLTGSTCEVFNGDSYVSSMKYTSTSFHSVAIAKRATKSGLWKYILAGILIVAGAVLTATGVFAAAGVALIAEATLVIGAALALTASGLETDKLSKIYNDAYEAGLKYAVDDNHTKDIFGTRDAPKPGSDDEIRWFGETISDLWFESSVNMNWRLGNNVGLTDFLNSPYDLYSPTGEQYTSYPTSGNDGTLNKDYKAGELDTYLLNKLTVVDSKQNNGRLYKGYSGAEVYDVNKDFSRRNKQKVYFALGIEYDPNTKNGEEFPHRIMYSEQSFQEELTDNYKVFLPNNYRDIDGETGPITNMFKIQNSLFVHTEEAIWNIPKNYQERVTNQIVSFLGTGSYFEIPPQKMVDDESGNSAGTSFKWGAIKTQHGYFFPCEKQNCFYMFDGKSMKPISDAGLKNELYYKIPLQINNQLLPGLEYLQTDNPSNPIGVGFISSYDSKKERILFTKKDFLLVDEITKSPGNIGDFSLCMDNGDYYYIPGYYNYIKTRESIGDTFLGIEGHTMKFLKSDDVVGIYISNPFYCNTSFTLSYSLKTQSWVSWHSYLPSFYLHTSQNFFSWKEGDDSIWKHNIFGSYQEFYGSVEPYILEYVSLGNPILNRIWDSIEVICEARKYDITSKEFYDTKAFFNKAILYNSRQCSGLANVITKNNSSLDYISNQVVPTLISDIIADNNERNWTINNLRDFRVDYTKPIFKSDNGSIKNEYFIDKILNSSTIDINKDWSELESFRDKYLVVRLIFDTFANPSADIKLLVNYSIENETQSFR